MHSLARAGLNDVDRMDQPIGAGHTASRGRRHFLFLQGLPGPFFRLLGRALREQGAQVSRINFNGGDMLDWPGEGAVSYRGTLADWPLWLDRRIDAEQVSHIVVFGDLRDIHRRARQVADRKGVQFLTFEEGYLRPDHVTLERGGVNGNSTFPRSIRALTAIAERLPTSSDAVTVENRFRNRARQAALHHLAARITAPLFPHYRSHRHASAAREGLAWLRRFLVQRRETVASERDLLKLVGRRFFLFPLQLEGDAQLRFHSPFATMHEAVRHVLESFREAPREVRLLIKQHPLDPDVEGWRSLVTAAANEIGVGDRVAFVERADLLPLLQVARGVITVNSTVGPLALAAGVPVKTLGNAIYDIPGITEHRPLSEFWHMPQPVDAENFDLLCRVLRGKCMVNGGFHSNAALELLVRNAAARLLAE